MEPEHKQDAATVVPLSAVAPGDAGSARTEHQAEAGARQELPCLELATGTVSFPARGHHLFLTIADLLHPLPEPEPADAEGLWLFRGESGVCGILSSRVPVLRDELPVTSLVILHHGQRLDLGGHAARFLEVQHILLTAGHRLVGRICPYCRESLKAASVAYRCPLCGVSYHEDCWQEISQHRCVSRNCHFSPSPLQEPPR